MTLLPDSAQTLAVLAAVAQGNTHISGLSTLREKETDRIEALRVELQKVGINTKVGPDFIEIEGGKPTAASIETYDDHRMAMSFAILAQVVDGIEICDPKVVGKSFPDYWKFIRECGLGVVE